MNANHPHISDRHARLPARNARQTGFEGAHNDELRIAAGRCESAPIRRSYVAKHCQARRSQELLATRRSARTPADDRVRKWINIE